MYLVKQVSTYLYTTQRVQGAVNGVSDDGLHSRHHHAVRRSHKQGSIASGRRIQADVAVTRYRTVHQYYSAS